MRKLILTIGPSCSGKTTWAEDFIRNKENISKSWVNINRDDIRFALHNNGERDWTRYKFTKSNEQEVSKLAEGMARDAVKRGHNIIVSDTNLNPIVRKFWDDFAFKNNYQLDYKLFDVDFDSLRKRNNQRLGGVSESVLWSQYLKMKEYLLGGKQFRRNGKLKAMIVDIDGTVAKMTDRGPFDWKKVGQDTPRKNICDMVYALQNGDQDYQLIFLSGRDSICYQETHNWLSNKAGFDEFLLYMRSEGDMRKDFIVKRELYEAIKDDWDIDLVIDDRPQVLRLWEEIGIPEIINVGGSIHKEF